jgi:hypothetical protein
MVNLEVPPQTGKRTIKVLGVRPRSQIEQVDVIPCAEDFSELIPILAALPRIFTPKLALTFEISPRMR